MADVSDSKSYRNHPLSMGRSYSERNIRRPLGGQQQQKRRNSEAYPRHRKPQSQKWKPKKPFSFRKKKKEQTLVRRRVLEGGFWTRLARRFVRDEVPVECLGELGVTASILYARDTPDTTNYFAVTNQIYDAPSKHEENLVCQGDSFEIRVVGMQVAKWDTLIPAISGNEIVLYSIEKDEERSYIKPPYIHFDYERDGNKDSTKANEYIPIPDSKSYVAGFRAPKSVEETYIDENGVQKKTRHRYKTKVKNHVEVKFKLIEIDAPNEAVRHALNGLDDLDGMIGGFSSSVPFLGLISPSIGITNMVTSKVLERYSSPDFIMSIDMCFQLADKQRAKEGTLTPGKYLKYGYYFFLSDPIDAKLYASVRSPEHVQLMLHQDPEYLEKMKKKRKKPNPILDREYFPLTDANYIVVRVAEPTGASDGRHRYQYLEDAHKLETIFRNARRGDESPGTTRRKIVKLGKSLGVFDSDSDSDRECGPPKCKKDSDLPLYPSPSPSSWESYQPDPLDQPESHLSTYHTTDPQLSSEPSINVNEDSNTSQSISQQRSDSFENASNEITSNEESSGKSSISRSYRRNGRNSHKTHTNEGSSISRSNDTLSKSNTVPSSCRSLSSNSSVRKNIDRIMASSKISAASTSKSGSNSVTTQSTHSEMTPASETSVKNLPGPVKESSSNKTKTRKNPKAGPSRKNKLKFSRNRSKKNSPVDENTSTSTAECRRDDFIRMSRRRN